MPITTGLIIFFVLIGILDLILRGFALWFSARNKQKAWFIFLFILSTAGILPAIYLIFFRKKRK